MRIIHLSLENENRLNIPICSCIGYFDGMHLGHQELLKSTINMSKEKGVSSALITFDKDPWEVLFGEKDIKHIGTLRQRINYAVNYGIQNIIILDFTKEMASLEPEVFIDFLKSRLNLKGMVCGFDFHYGSKGKGNPETLKENHDLDVEVVEAVNDEEGKISSTRISECITRGDMVSAYKMLGYPFTIEGNVIAGKHIGHDLGFPTANIKVDKEYLFPKEGVYAGFCKIGSKRYEAMINLGHNPTINYTKELSLEVHIIDYKEDIYNRFVSVEFIKYLRSEMNFKNKHNLIMQLEQDKRNTKKVLAEYE